MMSDITQITVGHALPIFERQVGLANWNRYAAVNDEFVPIHMDDAAGQAAGYPTAFGMGNLHTSYLHAMLRGWLDGRGRIETVEVRFRQPSTRGIVNRASGVVTSVAEPIDGIVRYEIEIWVEDGDGTRLTTGTATVGVPLA